MCENCLGKYPRREDFADVATISSRAGLRIVLVRHVGTARVLALKELSKRELIRHDRVAVALRERALHARACPHPHVLALHGAFQDENNLWFMLDYCAGGSLYKVVSAREKNRLSDDEASRVLAQLLSALCHLHRIGIVHCDVKPENVLLDLALNSVKLSDFGSAVALNEALEQVPDTTPAYCAPELLNLGDSGDSDDSSASSSSSAAESSHDEDATSKPERTAAMYGISPACDLWSFGCVLVFLLTGTVLFEDDTPLRIYRKIETFSEAQLRRVWHKARRDTSEPAFELALRLLHPVASLRLGAGEHFDGYRALRAHRFFDGIEWNKFMMDTAFATARLGPS